MSDEATSGGETATSEGSADDAIASAVTTETAESRPRVLLRWIGDLLSITVLAGTLIYLETWDGGSRFTGGLGVYRIALVILVASPVFLVESGRLGRWGAILIAAWGVGGLAALSAAQLRVDFVLPTITLGATPIVAVLTMRLWRRTWGPVAIFLIVGGSFAVYWYHALLAWWGGVLGNGSGGFWLPLSWHNQSAALMAAFGLIALGATIPMHGIRRVPPSVMAAAAFAGLWLTGSRGGLLSCMAGVVALSLAAIRRREVPALVAIGLVIGAAALLVLALTNLPGGSGEKGRAGSGQPIAGRESADTTFRDRLYYWDAAQRMFAARPLTGWGPGSYRGVSRQYTSRDVILTAYPHNEYLEVLAEGGLAESPVLIAAIAAALGALRIIWSRRRREPVRDGVALGAAGALIALGIHAGVDFDWTYLVITSLGAMTFGVVFAELRWRRTSGEEGLPVSWIRTTGAIPVVILLSLGVAGAAHRWSSVPTSAAPWDVSATSSQAIALARDGDTARAVEVANDGLRWNPGSPLAQTASAIAKWRDGQTDATAVVESLIQGRTDFETYETAARALLDGNETSAAIRVLEREIAYQSAYPKWTTGAGRQSMWELYVRARAQDGCTSAHAAFDRATSADSSPALRSALKQRLDAACVPSGGA